MGDSLGETELEDRARLDSSISHRAQAMARVVELEANTRSRAQAAALGAPGGGGPDETAGGPRSQVCVIC